MVRWGIARLMAALTAIAAITAAASIANAFSSARQKAPKIPSVPTILTAPDPNSAQNVADRNNASAKRARAPGIYAPPPTLLTGPNGLTGAAPVQRSTLLGE